MGYLKSFTVSFASTSTGSTAWATQYTNDVINGKLIALKYTTGSAKIGSSSFITLSGARTGLTLISTPLTASFQLRPTLAVCTSSGGAIELSTGGYAYDYPPVIEERIALNLTCTTGSTGDGTFIIVTEGG